MKPIKPYGDEGTLVLPWQDFSVPLYAPGNGKSKQDVVDADDSAYIGYNARGGKVTLIGDHAAEGFHIIKNCCYDHTAVIQTKTCSKTYRWVASMHGTNTNKGLIGCDGQDIRDVKYADLCLYTCNDGTGKNVTMVYFKYESTDNFELYDVEGQEKVIDLNKYLYSKIDHYISEMVCDENGAYSGGRAGDQTGKEWGLESWYYGPWTMLLRHPDQNVALKIAELGIAAALNDRIGYDYSQKGGYRMRLREVGYDPTKINVVCETDDASGIYANVKAAGDILGIKELQDIPICTIRNIKDEFVKAGFIPITDAEYLTGYDYLMPGDILLNKDVHAVTNVTLGKDAKEAWHFEIPDVPEEVIPTYVQATANVNIRKGPSTSYPVIGTLSKGLKVTYLGETDSSGGWYKVDYEKSIAWVSGKYSKLTT